MTWVDYWQEAPVLRGAACAEASIPAIEWTPDDRQEPTLRARETCWSCPVRTPCLAYASRHPVVGLWGGHFFRFKSSRAPNGRRR